MRERTNRILYHQPAQRWMEALPIGNGRSAAMIRGLVAEDFIELNEETVWAGSWHDRTNPNALESLPQLRKLLFEGKTSEAEKLAQENILSIPNRVGSYEPFGTLYINAREGEAEVFGAKKPLPMWTYKNYRRSLDFQTAVASVDYVMEDAEYHREYFASEPDQVIAIRYYNSGNKEYSLRILFERTRNAKKGDADEDTLLLHGFTNEDGVNFCGAVKVVGEGGNVLVEKHYEEHRPVIYVSGSTAVTIYIAMASDYRNLIENPCQTCLDRVRSAAAKGYDQVKRDHIEDFGRLYHNFSLELDNTEAEAETETDTIALLERARHGHVTPELAELYLNYNRYMLISASRPGSLPSNMQGKWNNDYQAAWDSDYHPNANMEINYWPSEVYGLGECCQPLFDWVNFMVPYGEIAAQRQYGARGWVIHHTSDIFGYAQPSTGPVGVWPLGGAWLCRHLYDHYLYSGNYDEMRHRLYPAIRGSVQFLLDYLIEAPPGTAAAGYLVTNPSNSPENTFITPDGEEGMLTYGAAIDIEIINDIFDACKDLIAEINKWEPGFDADFQKAIAAAQNRLLPVKISKIHQGIQEWAEDYEEKHRGHRHISPLYGVYPGCSITPKKTPELAAAAAQTLKNRFDAGYDGNGWCLAWVASVWARLEEPQKAYQALEMILSTQILPNLMINSFGVPQVADAQGTPAAILEMLAQSHADEIVLLPALPTQWPDGRVRGLRLRGGYTLDMEWKASKLVWAELNGESAFRKMPVRIACKGQYAVHQEKDLITVAPERAG